MIDNLQIILICATFMVAICGMYYAGFTCGYSKAELDKAKKDLAELADREKVKRWA